jgi:hypothetical protein
MSIELASIVGLNTKVRNSNIFHNLGPDLLTDVPDRM